MQKDPKTKDEEREKRAGARWIGLGLTLPFQMLAGPAVGFSLGYLLDRFLGTWPWMLLLLGLLGIVGGFYRVVQMVSSMED